MKKWILRMVLLLLVVIGIIGGIFVYNGHQVYQDAINAVSLSDKVDKIQKDENYIKLEDLPKDYKDAVISVEDRRYYNHGPIDLIGFLSFFSKTFGISNNLYRQIFPYIFLLYYNR